MLYVATGENEIKRLAKDKRSLNGKDPAGHRHRRDALRQPVRQPGVEHGHRNPEGSPSTSRAGSGPPSSATTGTTRSTRSCGGAYYGWPRAEGSDGPGGYTDPIAQLRPNRCSRSGIAIARGRAWIGALQGKCVYSVAPPRGTRGTVRPAPPPRAGPHPRRVPGARRHPVGRDVQPRRPRPTAPW
jgi:hypothetical protein